jgi:DNA polymerase III epsilon subunit family exonuclease
MKNKGAGKSNNYVVIDFETTGLDAIRNEIIEVAALKFKDKSLIDSYITLIKPKYSIPSYITQITGISNKMVSTAPPMEQVIPKLVDFIGDSIIVAHNASFDMKFLKCNAQRCGFEIVNQYIDTLSLSRKAFPGLDNHKLATVASHVGIKDGNWHRAEFDTRVTAEILFKCIESL